MNQISKIYFIVLLLSVSGCRNYKKNNLYNEKFDFYEIENGFLVCRLGNGFFSNYFRKYASKEQKYSHIGIVSIENDSLFVCHSEVSELTGVGFVKRERLDSFLQNVENYDFFELGYPDSTKFLVLKSIKSYCNKKIPFDLGFDSFDDSKLYCTELIATSINKAVDSIEIVPTLNLNNKILNSLDDIYQNKNVKKVTFANTK